MVIDFRQTRPDPHPVGKEVPWQELTRTHIYYLGIILNNKLCDRRMNMKIKGKVYRTVVRPALMYGAETWALKKAQENKLEVAEMRMLRWMCGVTKLDKIRNARIRGTTKVGEITKKVQERRLKWYGHVMRREEHYVGRRAMVMKVQGRRKRGRPKRRWLDKVKDDIKEKGLSSDDVYD